MSKMFSKLLLYRTKNTFKLHIFWGGGERLNIFLRIISTPIPCNNKSEQVGAELCQAQPSLS